jgi:hypothetical protein
VQHYVKAYAGYIGQPAAAGDPMERTRRVPYVPRTGRDFHYVHSPHFNQDGAIVYVKQRPKRPRPRPPQPLPLPEPVRQPVPEQQPKPQPQPRDPAPQPPGVDWGDVAVGAAVIGGVVVLGALTFGVGGAVAGGLLGGLFATS